MAKRKKTVVEKSEGLTFNDFFTPEMARKALAKALGQEEKDAIERLYLKVLHVSMSKTCSNCLSDAFFELYAIWKKDSSHFIDLYNCEYRLKGGVLLEIFSKASYFATNKNLTNKLAEIHLKQNRKKAVYFSVLPPDWESRL